MSDTSPPLTIHALRRLGAVYLARANAVMEHARRAGAHTYVPYPQTAAEYAGHMVIAYDTARQALEAIDYELRHVDPGENEELWREARDILAAAIAVDDARRHRVP